MGFSLLTYRRSVSVELGPLVVQTTTTSASDLVSFTCSALVNANAAAGQFNNCWSYLNATTGVNLAAQRAIANSAGYDPDAGSCTVARAFSTSVASGMGFEILHKLPAVTDDMGVRGIREIVNDTLMSLPPIDLLPVSGVTSQTAYDLTTLYPWLTDKSQIMGIYFQDTTDEVPRATGHRWDWHYDADAPRLLLPSEPFITGQTFYIKAHRIAQSWIKTSGTWASDTDGLQNDTDEALPLIAVVRAQSLATCYRTLGAMPGPDEYGPYYREREAFWTAKAYVLRWWDDQKGDENSGPKIRMVGGTGYGHARGYG